ncbi:MAG TPA: hypothetical protein VGE52_22055 [Pirellulales bacterium]
MSYVAAVRLAWCGLGLFCLLTLLCFFVAVSPNVEKRRIAATIADWQALGVEIGENDA